MQFPSVLLLALNLATIAYTAAVPEAAVEKRDPLIIALWKDAAYKGERLYLEPRDGQCITLSASFNDQASSVIVADNTGCLLFVDAGCNGRSLRLGGTAPHLIENLATVNFNDVASSLVCVYI